MDILLPSPNIGSYGIQLNLEYDAKWIDTCVSVSFLVVDGLQISVDS